MNNTVWLLLVAAFFLGGVLLVIDLITESLRRTCQCDTCPFFHDCTKED